MGVDGCRFMSHRTHKRPNTTPFILCWLGFFFFSILNSLQQNKTGPDFAACLPAVQHLHPVSGSWTTPLLSWLPSQKTYMKKKPLLYFFYYIKIQKFERKFSYGTKRWKWYGDMRMTLLSYSHRLSTGVRESVFIFSFHKAAEGDCILAGMLFIVVFRPGFTLLVEEMRDPRSKKSSRMVTGSPDSSGKWQKSNTNIIHKALVQHHTVWVNCSQKVKWSLVPDAMT